MNIRTLAPAILLAASALAQPPIELRVERFLHPPAGVTADSVFEGLVDQTAVMADLRRAVARQVEREKAQTEAKANPQTNFEALRLDKQLGEAAGGSGTTSLVSKGGAASLVSAALEAGPIVRASEGTITTFRVNALAFDCFLTGLNHPDHVCPVNPVYDSNRERALRGLSTSVSFDNQEAEKTTAQETKANFTPSPILKQVTGGGRLSSASIRYEFLPSAVTGSDIKTLRTAVANVQDIREKFLADTEALLDSPTWTTAYARFRRNFQVAGKTGEILVRDYNKVLNDLAVELANLDALKTANLSGNKVDTALTKMFSDILLKPKYTLELVHQAPSGQTPFLSGRFVGSKKFEVSETSYEGALTFNLAASVYERIPEGLTTGRWRSAQAALEYERKIGPKSWTSRSTFSLAAYYQYQINNAILEFNKDALAPNTSIPLSKPAAEILNTKGHTGIVQGKLTLALSKSVSIPMSVSWASRTELIPDKNVVRGQIGIGFDLGNLFSGK